ncbi:MAG: hypothetical protein NTZ53_04330 [Cyanobacteria bacterium]|nr:hypothetical protein [Cyanobacteriota bacterium]
MRPQILAALRQHGDPLRWAITAVELSRLRLEAVMLRRVQS